MKHFRWFALLSFLALSGCQTTPPPTADLTDAEARIGQAMAAEAEAHAPVELQFARDKLARAEALVAEKKHAEAMRLVAEARADADLALTRARAAKLRIKVSEQTRANTALRSELLGRGQ